ncbi:MAG: spore maturation protein [Deltaproteobacteria bacterium]|jgi:spore maturation protein SpmA/spore maturation protein SpmB|nr:spore maturation protein [Deltaproteobacteria bacterium]MBW2384398.1 spore maturation protein [Deltaproteobacteria bacterium]MBW2695298.1 spore maturation protein [Deltaproteobacteria bacterium]
MLVSIAYASLIPGRMEEVAGAILDGASAAIRLVIGLVGAMVLFLGLTRVAFDGGLRDWLGRAIAPVARRLFPEVPSDHPAMGAMVMNMSSNMMGLGNAATPFGLKAMGELAGLNRVPGSATNAMVLFLAINTSAITIFPPFGTIAVRQAAESADPWAIWAPTLIATTCSTVAAVTAYFVLGRLPMFRQRPIADAPPPPSENDWGGADDESDWTEGGGSTATRSGPSPLRTILIVAFVGTVLFGLVMEAMRLAPELGGLGTFKILVRHWLLPLLISGLLLIGVGSGVRAYDSMIAGGREGLQVAVRIVPYLVAILAAITMFRASGALGVIIGALDPYTSSIGVPAEVLPMALLRPLSGSGAFGVMSEIITTHGPDSFIGYLTCTLMGSTETTFYVLALYLGAAGVVDGRHALAACLIGDLGGFVGAVAACHFFFG